MFASTRRRAMTRFVHTEARIAKLGLVLPEVNPPKGAYQLTSHTNDHVYTAGHLPQPAGGDLILGRIGEDLTLEDGYEAARTCALSLIATLKHDLGDLDRVEKIVKLVGFVNCSENFVEQHLVMNGASDLLGEVFEERGVHARSAVGVNTLPLGVPTEVELVVRVRPAA